MLCVDVGNTSSTLSASSKVLILFIVVLNGIKFIDFSLIVSNVANRLALDDIGKNELNIGDASVDNCSAGDIIVVEMTNSSKLYFAIIKH